MARRRILIFGLILAALPPNLHGQGVVRQRPVAQNRAPRPGQPILSSGPMLIETSAPILNLLNRAEEGIARLDWKLAIDSLQRVIEDPEGALVESGNSPSDSSAIFESARRQATRRLSSLPPEGLEAYRVMYDGKAKGLLDRARAAHDADLLRTVVERFLLTRWGDDAADLLASWELDAGRPGRALAMLIDLRELIPDSDVPEDLVLSKLVASYAQLGQLDEASAALTKESPDAAPRTPPEWLTEFSRRAPAVRSVVGSSPAGVLEDGWARWPYATQPEIAPSLGFEPWTYSVGGGVVDWGEWSSEDVAGAALQLPPGRITTDGRRLFVRKIGGCAALDLDDLSPVWDSTASGDRASTRRYRNYVPKNAAAMGQGRSEDEIASAITSSHGLIFMIDRGTAVAGADFQRIQQQNPNIPVRASASRLVALDAGTGAVAWTRTSSGDPADLLNGAQFRHPPIGVGGELWMPYFKQSDLYFAILDPKDGTQLRSVLLGSARETIDPFGPAMPPVYADGVVFLPTGSSTLFAVDAHDHTVRWARQYDRSSRARKDMTVMSKGWTACEPLVRGGAVILAAADQPDLMAFSAMSGQSRWVVPIEGASYLIAADTERIWVGGRDITCVSLATGETLWSTQLVKPPSGRAALCGDRLLVPTVSGLLLLDPTNGRSVGLEAVAGSSSPLGNLTCSASALYSVEFGAIRKFPDIERTHARAVKQHESLPNDAAAALRLAWAELLRGEPERAWQLASGVTRTAVQRDPTLVGTLSKIKVEAALRLAKGAAPGSGGSLARLKDASASATVAGERLRCGFALADHYLAASQPEEAYRILWELGLEDSASETLRASWEVETSARSDIARRLAEVGALLPAGTSSRLAEQTARTLTNLTADLRNSASPRSSAKRLASLGQLDPSGATGTRALLIAAQWERGRGAYERADLLLGQIPVRSADPLLAAAAMVERCTLFDAETLDWSEARERCTRELGARFDAVTLPPIDGVTPRIPPGKSIGEWAARNQPTAATPSPGEPSMRVGALTTEPAWSRQIVEPTPNPVVGRLVQFDPPDPPVLRDRVVTFRLDGMLECVDAIKGDTLWQSELRLPGDFPEAFVNRGTPNNTEQPRRAVVDGQVAVFNHDDGLYAVGLLTGRRLWARGYDVVDLPGGAFMRDAAFDAVGGVVAAMPNEGKLSLLRLLDGSTLWERDLRGEPVDRVWIDGDRIVTSNASGERVHLFDRADGRLVQQILFDQPDGGGQAIRLVRDVGLLIGPQLAPLGSGVVAVSLATGQPVWSVELDLPLLQLFKPAEGFVGVSLGQGVVRVLDAKSGETALERTVPGGRTVSGGVLLDANFIVRTDGLRQQKPNVELTAFDVATGETVWQRQDIGTIVAAQAAIPTSGGVIPVLSETLQTNVSSTGAATPSYRPTLSLIDARTGGAAGQTLDLSMIAAGTRFSGDVILRDGVLIVGSNRGLSAFRTRPAGRPDGGKDF